MILDVPRFHSFIDKSFLTDGKELGLVEAYTFAVTLIESRPLLWTVHTVDGAIYSRVPTWALRHEQVDVAAPTTLDQWGAISSSGQIIAHQYLKDYWVKTPIEEDGIYKFTIDYFESGFSEDPEQHKTSNIIFLDSGLIAALPNNLCLFKDRHFTNEEPSFKYERNKQYFMLD